MIGTERVGNDRILHGNVRIVIRHGEIFVRAPGGGGVINDHVRRDRAGAIAAAARERKCVGVTARSRAPPKGQVAEDDVAIGDVIAVSDLRRIAVDRHGSRGRLPGDVVVPEILDVEGAAGEIDSAADIEHDNFVRTTLHKGVAK